jgi:hypothetical protein
LGPGLVEAAFRLLPVSGVSASDERRRGGGGTPAPKTEFLRFLKPLHIPMKSAIMDGRDASRKKHGSRRYV